MRGKTGAVVASFVVALAIVALRLDGTAAGRESGVTSPGRESSASLEFALAPKVLPARGRQIAKLVIGIEEGELDGIPPGISRATFGIDRAIQLDSLGLSPCRSPVTEGIQVDSAGGAGTDCRRSIVGHAEAKIMFAYPETKPMILTGRGIVYFAGNRPGGSDLLVEIPFGIPMSANLDLIVPIRSVSEGRIGSEATVMVPKIADGYGLFRSLRLELGRAYSRGGERVDYVDAECRRGQLRAVLSVELGDGTEARGESTCACTAG